MHNATQRKRRAHLRAHLCGAPIMSSRSRHRMGSRDPARSCRASVVFAAIDLILGLNVHFPPRTALPRPARMQKTHQLHQPEVLKLVPVFLVPGWSVGTIHLEIHIST